MQQSTSLQGDLGFSSDWSIAVVRSTPPTMMTRQLHVIMKISREAAVTRISFDEIMLRVLMVLMVLMVSGGGCPSVLR
ncbi:Protein of unknown function [Pyronema omphalodes CBS 100304]|uniref:Uncharacterized protein n=1 Tax=Pyronema omphalodes (strain CBS 100304) TaxID=1076935 RepID=U4L9U2_PYROM|nr:Protein of unknown function [Pyronema omphalodes CBS 100304]